MWREGGGRAIPQLPQDEKEKQELVQQPVLAPSGPAANGTLTSGGAEKPENGPQPLMPQQQQPLGPRPGSGPPQGMGPGGPMMYRGMLPPYVRIVFLTFKALNSFVKKHRNRRVFSI